ncbi:MAG TPA: type II 3-dehydroquinate dehydratase, partial [Pseudogracilibacillus sp.]|nr:type II 3-dehydroquinate dehydratase [Pseudogracilibacillus sp.]
REEFRKKSFIAPVCYGHIAGFGILGYRLAVMAFLEGTM